MALPRPPVLFWGAVALLAAVALALRPQPMSAGGLAVLALCVTLGVVGLAPRGQRLLCGLVGALVLALGLGIAGRTAGLGQDLVALITGAALATLCAKIRSRWGAILAAALAAAFLVMAAQLGPQLGAGDLTVAAVLHLWPRILPELLASAGLAALVQGQIQRLGAQDALPLGAGVWQIEAVALLAACGFVGLCLAANASGLLAEGALALAAGLACMGAVARPEITPRLQTGAAVLFLASWGGGLGSLGLIEALVFALLGLVALTVQSAQRPATLTPEAELAWLDGMQSAAGAWILLYDPDHDELIPAPAARARFGPRRRMGDWLTGPDAALGAQLQDLLQAAPGAHSIVLTLRDRSAPAPYALSLIGYQGRRGVVLLRSLATETALSDESQALRKEIDQIRLREERLLTLASHELRTPAATLSMLAEEIDEGEPWEELRAPLRTAVAEILAVLGDLRAGSGTEGARAATECLVPLQIAKTLAEEFGPLAQTLRVDLVLDLPQGPEARYHCDAARVAMVLEKISRYALGLEGLQQLRLSLVAVPLERDRVTLVWTLAPSGAEVLPLPDPGLFEPFATGPEAGTGAQLRGAGLYTAERAATALGGRLALQPAPAGWLFVLTHPARRASATLIGGTEP